CKHRFQNAKSRKRHQKFHCKEARRCNVLQYEATLRQHLTRDTGQKKYVVFDGTESTVYVGPELVPSNLALLTGAPITCSMEEAFGDHLLIVNVGTCLQAVTLEEVLERMKKDPIMACEETYHPKVERKPLSEIVVEIRKSKGYQRAISSCRGRGRPSQNPDQMEHIAKQMEKKGNNYIVAIARCKGYSEEEIRSFLQPESERQRLWPWSLS
ncbi:MAG: hypothetical protein HON29_00975, partial [Candidatus Magasanikbacteria bacterium]|nr:hypothetical protein [Candidatus Magasanikbacteria bacterium]